MQAPLSPRTPQQEQEKKAAPTAPVYKKPAPRPAPIRKPKPVKPKERHADFVIIFEEGGADSHLQQFISDEENTGDAVIDDLMYCIEGSIPVIVSSVVLFSVLAASQHSKSSEPLMESLINPDQKITKKEAVNQGISILKKDWSVRINKAKDFTILIPNDSPYGASLTSLGLIERSFDNFWDIIKTYQLPPNTATMYETSINIQNFANLFDRSSLIRKRFYATGHGTSQAVTADAYIAGMNRNQYRALLELLNNLHTDFLAVSSCFAGGVNLEEMHKDLVAINQQLFSTTSLNYILAINATTDTETETGEDIETFFENLDIYFKTQKLIYLKQAIDALRSSRANIASIRFPGSNSLFRAMALHKSIQTLTVTELKKYKLQNLQQGKSIIPLEVRETVLLYPAIIEIPLLLGGGIRLSHFISMINGNAIHVFNEIKGYSLADLVHSFKQEDTLLHKVFFIKTFSLRDTLLENVVIESNKGDNSVIIFKVKSHKIPNWNGTYFKLSRKNILDNTIFQENKVIAHQEALKEIRFLINEAMPTESALYQATGGQQTISMIQKTVQEMLSPEIPTLKEMPDYSNILGKQLMDAIMRRQMDAIKDLLASGANPNYRNAQGSTPLILVPVLFNDKAGVAVIKELLRYKADINAQTNDGLTVLMYAVHSNQLAMVQELLKYKPDLLLNWRGNTALDLARKRGNPQIIKMLEEYQNPVVTLPQAPHHQPVVLPDAPTDEPQIKN